MQLMLAYLLYYPIDNWLTRDHLERRLVKPVYESTDIVGIEGHFVIVLFGFTAFSSLAEICMEDLLQFPIDKACIEMR